MSGERLSISKTWRGIRYRIRCDIRFKFAAIAWQKGMGMDDAMQRLRRDISELRTMLRASYDPRRRRRYTWELGRYKF